MAYITKSNSLKILSKVESGEINNISEEVYIKPIYFFSDYERNKLIAFKEFLKDPNNFIRKYYIPIETTDNLKFVYEGGKPSYHFKSDCERLNSNYRNFEIPESIRERGKEEVTKFRKWFRENQHLLENPEIFAARIKLAFGIIINPKAIDFENSGVEVKQNLNLYELEEQINLIISKAGQYYNAASDEKKAIIRRYQKHTFLAYSNKEIKNNNTRFKDEVIKEFLKQYDAHFKKPIKNLLIEYHMVKYNPNLQFEGFLLEKLGFRPCASCHQEYTGLVTNKSIFDLETDDLPF